MLRRLLGRRVAAASLPLPNTYWVRTGRMLAGEYPGGADEGESRQRFARLRDAGIDHFVDLTQIGELTQYRHLLPAGSGYHRHPILDMEVPLTIAHMQAIQRELREALEAGHNPYVHCRAGIGRTGTVIGCFLVEQGLDGEAALRELNILWRQSACSKRWPKVPQTREQTLFIQRWPNHRHCAKKPVSL
ncbi:MAG: dual specificity protein phosphatase family protein [Gammaproteobacteria bacterium]